MLIDCGRLFLFFFGQWRKVFEGVDAEMLEEGGGCAIKDGTAGCFHAADIIN